MSLLFLQEKLLTYTSLIYLAATLSYIIYLGKRSKSIGRAATLLGLTGVVLHTFGLAFRWIAAGLDHPPFTNLYESLVFFGWGIVIFYLYMEWRYKVKIAGAFVFPIALAAMGIAVTHQKDIMPLPDALKSWWLHIHVMFAAIAYAAFVVAFAFSLMFLIRDKVSRSTFGLVVSVISALSLLMVQTRAGIDHIFVFFLRKAHLHAGRWLPIPISGSSPPEYQVKEIPIAGPLLVVTIALLAIAAVAFLLHLLKESESTEKVGGFSIGLASMTFLSAVTAILFYGWKLPDATLKIDPFLFSLLAFLCISCMGVAFLFLKGDALIERLPPVDTLDFLSYRSIMVAFPLMTIVIITGAVWAQSAWGRYWGWDPKETASLVTWFVYAIYLHMRIVAGWKNRPSATINIVGFLSVIFTYLGVNVFLSGLHSYAKSF